MDSSGPFVALEVSYGVGFWVWLAYAYALLLAGAVLVVSMLVRSRSLYSKQGGVLLFGVSAPWLGNVLYLSGLSPVPNLDLTPFFLLLTGLAMVIAISRFGLLDVVPVARAAVVEGMNDGMIVLDEHNRILDLNPVAQFISKLPASKAVGLPADRVISNEEVLREVYGGADEARAQMEVGHGSARRGYEVSLSLLRGTGKRQRIRFVVVRDVTERKRLEERLVHQAIHDPLTGLPNRNLALDRLQQALARARRTRGSAAVLFLDLDNFKVINDSLGHEVGDRLLTAAAGRLRECVRVEDTAARLGGDEFAIVLENVSGKDEAAEVAERVEERFRVPFILDNRKLFVGTSIGIAVGDSAGDRPDELMRKADLAMYRAKRRGKARYEVFEPAMDEEVQGRLQLENDLRSGFEGGEFELYYQPKVSIEDGVVVAFEALLRWEHPERGLLLPRDFIQTVEEIGLIVPFGRWVLREACRQVKEWHERHPGNHSLVACVNVSAKQLEQTDLVEAVSEVLNETGLEPRDLALELTEGAFISEDSSISNTLRRLRELGIKLVIDDFGIGYSSLSYLRRLPVDFLKIDRSFIEKLGREHEETTIVRVILQVSHALGIKVTAEGVETEDQLSRLREMRCDLAQGHYFARPMPAREVAAYLTKGFDR